jgi:hypothetical protein
MYPSTRDDKTTGVPVPAPETTTAAQQIPPLASLPSPEQPRCSSAAQPGINDPIQPRPRLALRCSLPASRPAGWLPNRKIPSKLLQIRRGGSGGGGGVALRPCGAIEDKKTF